MSLGKVVHFDVSRILETWKFPDLNLETVGSIGTHGTLGTCFAPTLNF
jgi:hypothetical protein